MSKAPEGAPTKQDLQKIHDFLWEIPKSFRSDMRVPARIYASEKMLDELFKDRSLWQLVNLTTLPGIHDYALVMPDVHEGYGSSVGGVAAIREEGGVVSPGMCVQGDTRVLHSLGYYVPIREFENSHEGNISCANFTKKAIEKALVTKFWKLETNPSIYRVTTRTGQVVDATADHPLYTPQGMVPLGKLKPGSRVALYPFVGVPYQKPQEHILIDEKKISAAWQHLGKNPHGHGLTQTLNQLRKRDLLPLKTTSPQFPILLKIMGYLLGDGTMFIGGKRKKGKISFYGRESDLTLLKKDIASIGFAAVLSRRTRTHTITTAYRQYTFQRKEVSVHVAALSFVLLLSVLGIPSGNKAKQDFVLPRWLFQLPTWQKRLFLAGLFGAELTAPSTFKKHGFNFYAPVLGVNKVSHHLRSGRRFLQDIARLLEACGVQTATISQRKEQRNRDGSVSYRLRLILVSNPLNLFQLWSTIGYEYQSEKQRLANFAAHYIRLKQRFIEEKILARGIRTRKGKVVWQEEEREALQELTRKGGRDLARPCVGQFPTFHAFVREASSGLGRNGMVWDSIETIKKIPFKGFVYDLTVTHRDHNFVANNFVVSNCGYDINCGVRLLRTGAKHGEVKEKIPNLATEIYREVPSGVGRGGALKLSQKELDEVLAKGARWMVEREFGVGNDLLYCESRGTLPGADPAMVSSHAKNRGCDQLGTMGAGNHFVEVERVGEIFDQEAANALGLFPDEVTILIHCGSRGMGHQVATDYIRIMLPLLSKYGIRLVDRELACAPFTSEEGQSYFKAMASSANFAWANRQLITFEVRKAWRSVFGEVGREPELIYDVAHNIVKREEYGGTKVLVHRKGATRAFPPGNPEIPEDYSKSCGQPVFIPGSMGTSSFVLVGTEGAIQSSFGSSAHGAGRTMSRTKAKQIVNGKTLHDALEKEGIAVRAGSLMGLAEEAPLAYKDVEKVVEVLDNAGISRKVAKLKPVAVIKG